MEPEKEIALSTGAICQMHEAFLPLISWKLGQRRADLRPTRSQQG